MAEEVECCQLRRGVTVVVRCCTCAPEDRPRRKVVEVRAPEEAGFQAMVKLDKAVVLQVCNREPGDKKMPHGRLLIPREYVHRVDCERAE